MTDNRLLLESFNRYYDRGMAAMRVGDVETASRNLYQAANTILKLAKVSEPGLKVKYSSTASRLIYLADEAAKRTVQKEKIQSNSVQESSNVKVVTNDCMSLEESLAELDKLIGLKSVKKQVKKWVDSVKVSQTERKMGKNPDKVSNHLMFLGNPGTGKTTAARLIANICCALGLTSTNTLVEVGRDDLVGDVIGATEAKTTAVIDKAIGGVLFIDEAYTLAEGGKDFGKHAVEKIMKAMEDNRDNFIVIVAGYEDKMGELFKLNPGIKDRFRLKIYFDDYTPKELMDIFLLKCKDKSLQIEKDAKDMLNKIFNFMFETKDKQFGNGRAVRNLYEDILDNRVERLVAVNEMAAKNQITEDEQRYEYDVIKLDDLPKDLIRKADAYFEQNSKEEPKNQNKVIVPEKNILEGCGKTANSEYKFDWDNLPVISFSDVAGLNEVKEEVKTKVLLPLLHPEALEGYEKKNGGGLLLFGPPGTGKTMIAAAIANEIGAKFCAVKPSDLIHQGAGNTEKAVRCLFAQARQFPCSVIYFDEMDSIAQKDTRSTYAKQLRSELLAQLQGVESYGEENNNILYLIASTNKPWEMDSAFIRPGRFGTRIYVGLPDDDARRYMIEKRLNKLIENGKVNVSEDIDVDKIVELTNGFNGSDMTNLLERVEEHSILRSFEGNAKEILSEDFDFALSKTKSSVQYDDIEKLQEWINKNNS